MNEHINEGGKGPEKEGSVLAQTSLVTMQGQTSSCLGKGFVVVTKEGGQRKEGKYGSSDTASVSGRGERRHENQA